MKRLAAQAILNNLEYNIMKRPKSLLKLLCHANKAFHAVSILFFLSHINKELYQPLQLPLTGMGIRLSWLIIAEDTNTSAICAPQDLNPPAVPALMTTSGLKAWMAR
jgi:hypothetical protein